MSDYGGFKVLVANRGEIALRIMRSCRELGMPTVAIYSEPDEQALHTRYADELVCVGPANSAQSYLNMDAILAAARKTGAKAIHPGYGFLSENSDFVQAVEDAGLVFIGPRPETVALTGDKLAARRMARETGLPVLPGPDEPLDHGPIQPLLEGQIVFPVLIKAVAGGGGRGIRLANNSTELEDMVSAARKEAQASFGNDEVYLEPLVLGARHIEVQIIGDGNGNVICLGERECSIQRRRQKLIEEAPASHLPEHLRLAFQEDALKLARRLNYRGLGTIEFLLDKNGEYFFIEVNPRIQVEHPVTEMVTGIDLVREQLILAVTGKLRINQKGIVIHGSAIEARVLAEDTNNGFLPATGEISHLLMPGGMGVRVDTSLYLGMPIDANYDSLLAKVIVWDENRGRALGRMKRALQEFQIGGVPTDLAFLQQIVTSSSFRSGRTDTTYLDHFLPLQGMENELIEKDLVVAIALLANQNSSNGVIQEELTDSNSFWKFAAWREQMGILP